MKRGTSLTFGDLLEYAPFSFIIGVFCTILMVASVLIKVLVYPNDSSSLIVSILYGCIFVFMFGFFVAFLLSASNAVGRKIIASNEHEWAVRTGLKITLAELKGKPDLIPITQRAADVALSILGECALGEMSKLIELQSELKELKRNVRTGEAAERLERYRSCSTNIARQDEIVLNCKISFWRFHRVCEETGFKVRKSIKDYGRAKTKQASIPATA